jgi:hypothetical protein
MKTNNVSIAIPALLLLCFGLLFAEATFMNRNLQSAKAEAFNEGRLRQCTYTLECDMKSLKAELFDQQRNLDKQTKKSGN